MTRSGRTTRGRSATRRGTGRKAFGPGSFADAVRTLRLHWTVAGTILAVTILMLFGGGVPGVVTTFAFAIAGLILLACAMGARGTELLREQPLAQRVGLLGIALLPLLQIVPLPPAWWQALPGQELRIRTLALAGLADSWQPLSLTPVHTAGAAVVAIGFTALVALLVTLPRAELRRVAWAIMAIMAANIAIGLIQVSTGGQALQLHRAADHGAFLGFYANKNHAALVLAASLPIAAFLLGWRENPRGMRVWLGLYAGVVLVALVTTNSRAGIALGVLAIAVLGAFYLRRVRRLYVVAGVVVLAVAALAISTTQAFDTVFSRFGNVGEDLRWQYLWTSRPIIDRYWLFGSGIGSFSTLYAVGEQLAWLKPTYVNQLHNEYPQLLLETGIPGLVVLGSLVAGVAWRIWRIWSRDADARFPVVCGILVLVLIAAHSAVDYPLRRPAVLPILALAMAMAIRGDLVASTGFVRRKPRASSGSGSW